MSWEDDKIVSNMGITLRRLLPANAELAPLYDHFATCNQALTRRE